MMDYFINNTFLTTTLFGIAVIIGMIMGYFSATKDYKPNKFDYAFFITSGAALGAIAMVVAIALFIYAPIVLFALSAGLFIISKMETIRKEVTRDNKTVADYTNRFDKFIASKFDTRS
jgi:ABC-type dipeptide/oligopeptide/nickel transport system permease component